MQSHGRLVSPHHGTQVWVVDELMRFVATGQDTGGAYTLTESVVVPGGGPPTHIHRREDEAFWVLEGDLEVTVGEQVVNVPAGGFVHLPRDVPHRFVNVGTVPARFLTMLVPAGLEGFFEAVGVPHVEGDSPPLEDESHIASIIATAPQYGLEILPVDATGE